MELRMVERLAERSVATWAFVMVDSMVATKVLRLVELTVAHLAAQKDPRMDESWAVWTAEQWAEHSAVMSVAATAALTADATVVHWAVQRAVHSVVSLAEWWAASRAARRAARSAVCLAWVWGRPCLQASQSQRSAATGCHD